MLLLLQVGLVPQLGACQAWQLHKPSLRLAYSRELWRGSRQELAALRKPITAGNQVSVVECVFKKVEQLEVRHQHVSLCCVG
jgi:hypothetical protein